jgi:predicted DNA-binding transcriptional regulator AlpA
MAPAYRDANEFPHRGLLNLREVEELTGYSNQALLRAIWDKELFATKHRWRYGIIGRTAWFVNARELQRWVAWRAINKALRELYRYET